MRKYQAIWVKLKQEGVCRLTAHPSLHKRIKKAVSKEKCSDVAYKLQWDMAGAPQPELVRLTDPNNPAIVIFKLTTPITVGDL
jgi:hypothetical protein